MPDPKHNKSFSEHYTHNNYLQVGGRLRPTDRDALLPDVGSNLLQAFGPLLRVLRAQAVHEEGEQFGGGVQETHQAQDTPATSPDLIL